jgi:hypothetical protein
MKYTDAHTFQTGMMYSNGVYIWVFSKRVLRKIIFLSVLHVNLLLVKMNLFISFVLSILY